MHRKCNLRKTPVAGGERRSGCDCAAFLLHVSTRPNRHELAVGRVAELGADLDLAGEGIWLCGAGLAAASQHAVQRGHIAPARRAETVRAGRGDQGRKSHAWSQHGGNMEHTEQAGVMSHTNTTSSVGERRVHACGGVCV